MKLVNIRKGDQQMGQLADALKKLQQNPDDLTTLPQLIAQVEGIENNEMDYQTKIKSLQDINRAYLAQIPIPSQNPHEGQGQGEPPAPPTIDDAKQALINALGGNK